MGREENKNSEMEGSAEEITRADLLRREVVSVVVWGIVIGGFVVAVAFLSSMVFGWGGDYAERRGKVTGWQVARAMRNNVTESTGCCCAFRRCLNSEGVGPLVTISY